MDGIHSCPKVSLHLVFSQRSDDQRTHHSRQSSHAIGDSHQDTGIARGDIQVVDIKPWEQSETKNHAISMNNRAAKDQPQLWIGVFIYINVI